MWNCSFISFKSSFLFIIAFNFFFSLNTGAQKRAPFIFRKQEQKTSKRIHHYLKVDTLIKTSKASIHINYSNKPGKPYLLMLHGMGVDGKTNWYKQIPALSKHYNLIIPDLIFFGKSTSAEQNYSVEFQAEQIHEAIKTLKIDSKLYIMGFSYGGITAAVYNQLYSEDISKLIIIDGPVKFFSAQTADSLAVAAGVASMMNVIIPQNIKDFSAMEKAVLSRKYPATRKLKYKIMNQYFIPGAKIKQLQLSYLIVNQSVYQNYNYHLDKTSTLLIWGGKDGVVPVSVGERLHANYPEKTKLLIFKKAKHDTHFRCAKKLNKAVVNFLEN